MLAALVSCQQCAVQLSAYISQHVLDVNAVTILSNHQPEALFEATCELADVTEDVALGITRLSQVTSVDTYRAVTHNKGIMNGVDALMLATGNDTRAVAAAVHAYAAESGSYQGLSSWTYRNGVLQGVLRMPIPCGVVGGITQVHPMAKLAHKLLGFPSRMALGEIACAVGLLQNLAALRALAGEGIVSGHMRLHITNLLLGVCEDPALRQALWPRCYQHLQARGTITQRDVLTLMAEFRQDKV